MEFTYRKLESKDAGLYRALRLQALQNFPETFGAYYSEEAQEPELEFEQYLRTQHPDKFVFGAFAQESLMGKVAFKRDSLAKIKHKGLLVQLYVSPDCQGHHVRFHLMNTMLGYCFSTLQGLE